MKTSIMDQIKILKSSRRKTDPKVGRAIAPAAAKISHAVTPASAAPPCTTQLTTPTPTQQWVPVLVLDISQASSLTDTTTNSPLPSNIPVKFANNSSGVSENQTKVNVQKVTIPKSFVISQNAPVIPNTAAEKVALLPQNSPHEASGVADTQQTGGETGVTEAALTTSSSPPDSSYSKDQDSSSGLTVCCILCDKSFPTLEEMQAHYLSTHKARRARDGARKRKTNTVGDSSGQEKGVSSDMEQNGSEQDKEESPLPAADEINLEPKCPVCSLNFSNSEEVNAHIKEVHAYICSECNSTFYNLFNFTNHKCAKGSKKVKRVKKKINGGAGYTSLLKPEVTKILNDYVLILPKSKKKPGAGSKISQQKDCNASFAPSPTTPSVRPDSTAVASENNEKFMLLQETVSEADQVNSEESELTNSSLSIQKSNCNYTEINYLEAEEPSSLENLSGFCPAIEMTYSLNAAPDSPIPSLNNNKHDKREIKPITVIETRHLDQARQFIKEPKTPDTNCSKNEQIKEKIALLKRNPNLSISWHPKVQSVAERADGEYVCGRCNVLCDDMEDYMDHLHDCLTMSSVTLEPVSNPPRRLLKLSTEPTCFGSHDMKNSQYSINKSILSKLQPFLSQSQMSVNTSTAENTFVPPVENTLTTGNLQDQTYGDLVEDDYRCQSHESVDLRMARSSSPECPPIKNLNAMSLSLKGKLTAPVGSSSQSLKSHNNSKGTPPMVIIPMDSKDQMQLSMMPELLTDYEREKIVRGVPEGLYCDPSSPAQAGSPLGLLLDHEDIKMEVEEEVVEDHFEVS